MFGMKILTASRIVLRRLQLRNDAGEFINASSSDTTDRQLQIIPLVAVLALDADV
jgi:hypothetical protein